MKKYLLVIALLVAPASQAYTWDYEPWRSIDSASTPQARATLSIKQAGIGFAVGLESVGKQPPVWTVTVSSADKIVGFNSIRALNPDSVQDDQLKILSAERLVSPGAEGDEQSTFRAVVTADGMSNIKFSASVEIGVAIEGDADCPSCTANATYTIDTSGLSLAFVDFDIHVRRLPDVDVSRAYLLEYDRKHNPLNTVPQDLWMIAPDEVEKNRVQLSLTQDEILSMSQYDIQNALYDQSSLAFEKRQAATAARDAAAQKAGEDLFRMLTVFEFFEPENCVAPDIPEVLTTQEQADAFNKALSPYQNCLKNNQDRDAGAYSAVIAVLGYQLNPDTYAVKEPEDLAFSGAVLLACEALAPEVGQCSSAISAIAQTFGEKMQGVNQQYAQFQENIKHLSRQ